MQEAGQLVFSFVEVMQNSFFLLLIFGCAILLVCPLAAFGSEEGASCAPIAQIVGPGTTSNLEAIYKGICYQTVKSAQCDASWSQFQQIVLSKDPSSFNWRDFEVRPFNRPFLDSITLKTIFLPF